MSESLTLKYRPHKFEDVVGQQITATILRKAVETGTFKHVYLLAGSSGCGKTTLARILAYYINGGVGNPIEIDAASNSGVDNVRTIIESANQRSLNGKYKIFIIDECHAISNAGWQAFLKGIEEPPEYTIFIFCTTEPNKIPATILNRVQRYNIAPISSEGIKSRLMYICEKEGFTNYEDACDLISKTCNNGMRDAIALLEQCADYSTDLSIENVNSVLGNFSYDLMFNLTCALLNKDMAMVLDILDKSAASGTNLKTFVDSYLAFGLDLATYCLFKNINITSIPAYLEPRCAGFSNVPGALDLANKISDGMLELKALIKYDVSYRTTIKAYFVKMIRGV